MSRFVCCVAVAGLMVGCATSPVPVSEAVSVPASRLFSMQEQQSVSAGKVTVTRDSGVMGRGCLIGFYVGGVLAATFEPGETATFNLPAKTYILGAAFPPGRGVCSWHSGEPRELEVAVGAGEQKYFRLATREGDGAALEATSRR